MMMNSDISETTLVGIVSEDIRKRLPPEWQLCDRGWRESELPGKGYVDAALEIRDPQGCSTTIIVEVKRKPIEARQVGPLLDSWRRMLLAQSKETAGSGRSFSFMVVTPYLGPSARERLSEAGISFADSTGNVRFVINRPAVFIESQGAAKNPWREDAPLRSLKGPRTARVVRGFLDYRPPFGTRELAGETRSSAASVSRVSSLLEREAIIYREAPRGRIFSVDWERLVRRWSVDYDFVKANALTTWIEPRGTRAVFNRLRNSELTYAVTGSFAAIHFAPVAEPRLVTIYAANPDVAAERLGLRPADTGGNVLIGRPFDSVVFDRVQSVEGITYAHVTQVLVDLMKGPGRGPAEAEGLVEWMRDNEDRWQLPLTRTT